MRELIPIGILVIFVGVILVFIGALTQVGKSDTKIAVGGFIGFIPFGFANDERMLYIVVGITIVFMLIGVWFIFNMSEIYHQSI